MLRCTWGAGVRAWGSVGRPGPSRGLRAHGLCSGPRASAAEKAPKGPVGALALDAGVPQDVLLYEYDRERTFFGLGVFCIGQAGFWGCLAYIAFTSSPEPAPKEPQDAPKEPQDAPKEKKPLNFPLLVGIEDERSFNLWRLGFTGACLAAGFLVVGSAYLFCRRSLSRVLLHRGGQAVTMTSYYPFGFTSTFTVPLHQVSGLLHRSQARAMVPIKVKNKLFYYLVDKQGYFSDATLFDLTVGAYRKL